MERKPRRGGLTMIGDMLDRLCKQKHWDWTDLARASGVDKATVSRVLQGRSRPRPETLEKICTALGIEDQEICDDIFVVYGLSTEDMQERALERLHKRLGTSEHAGK